MRCGRGERSGSYMEGDGRRPARERWASKKRRKTQGKLGGASWSGRQECLASSSGLVTPPQAPRGRSRRILLRVAAYMLLVIALQR